LGERLLRANQSHKRRREVNCDFGVPQERIINGKDEMKPNQSFQRRGQSRQFRVDSDGYVLIDVSPQFVGHDRALLAVLAHEACHHILGLSGIRKEAAADNERLTDLAICRERKAFPRGMAPQTRGTHRVTFRFLIGPDKGALSRCLDWVAIPVAWKA
jgi:hypothetical protein